MVRDSQVVGTQVHFRQDRSLSRAGWRQVVREINSVEDGKGVISGAKEGRSDGMRKLREELLALRIAGSSRKPEISKGFVK